MMRTIRTACTCVLLATASAALADLSEMPSGAYGLDPDHAYITISYSHVGFSRPHVGFEKFDLELQLDSEKPQASRVQVTIDVGSIDSRVDEFDGHLNGEDFFDTAKHPTITFVSNAFEMTGEDTAKVSGDLTVKNVTRPVTLDVTINKAANHPMSKKPTIGITAETTLSRSEWDLGKYVPMVSDDVVVYISAEMPKK